MTAIEYSIVVACLLLAAFLVWKEIRRANKARLILRIIASVLATASLALLAIPVYFKTTEIYETNVSVLLTNWCA